MSIINKCLGLCRTVLKRRILASGWCHLNVAERHAEDRCSPAIHTSCARRDLMEFFEPKDNWGAQEVKSGKSWSTDELRIKSNSDLHKLWYVLLKELNMLLTMEEAAKEACEYFPSPERIDKVRESMDNLETVVRERNEAYFLLETGETGEQPWILRENIFGLVTKYAKREHLVPRNSNPKGYFLLWRNKDLADFLRLYREKALNREENFARRDRLKVMSLLKRFPHTDRAVLAQQYPGVDLDKVEELLSLNIFTGYAQH
ncbi:39S ribosomal protein L47, mitochondrial [Ixodes scapularis]|uniref:39S ribosomal protein L47, mitochondrial n=1 Tax=Ixodes scapularis TaxID=6945 RepID=UPI0011615C8E|nr:39S ribosomal protein L47, mitochondrial [Ixodes scapularis]